MTTTEPCIRVPCPPFEPVTIDLVVRYCAAHGFHGGCPICAALDPLANFTPVPASLLP